MFRLSKCTGVLALVIAAGATCALAFEGRVVDERSGSPVAGATVTVAGRPGEARTDGDGRFVLAPDPPAPFDIVILLPGRGVARPHTVRSVDPAAVTTIPVATLVEESITVSGVAPSIDATPGAGTTLLSREQIARRAPANLMQALESVPGVSQVSEAQAAVPALRGLARGRTLILVDGARVTSERRVGPSATYLDPAIAEGLDVARGPGSVAYGSDALGGVISLRTRRAAPGEPLRVRVEATAGTGVPERRGVLEVSGTVAGGGLLALAHARSAEDYDAPDGEVFNSGYADRGLLLRYEHAAGAGYFSLGYQGDFARDTERPRNNSRTVRFYYPYENSHRLTAAWDVAGVAGFEKIALSGFFGTYEQRTDQDRFSAPARSIERADVSARDVGLRAVAERIAGRSSLEFGIDLNGRLGLEANEIRLAWDTGGVQTRNDAFAAVDDARRIDTGVFAQARTAVVRSVVLAAGVRGDRVTTRNTGGYFGDRSSSHSALSGFGALTAGPFRGLTVTAQVARGFRDPVLSDRYYRGPSGRGYVTGNPDLDPEKSLQFDLALRGAVGPVRVGAYAFRYDIDDLIERYASGPTPDDFMFRNRDRGRLRGFEFELQTGLGAGFALEAGAQRVRGTTRDDGKNLDDVPADNASLALRKDWARFYTQLRVACFARDDRPGPTETAAAAPGYTRVDVHAGWRIGSLLELRAQVRNVLDARYWASPDTRWVYAPGRAATLTAVFRSGP